MTSAKRLFRIEHNLNVLRLERDRFHWPRAEAAGVTLTGQELNWLLDGFDLRHWRPHAPLHVTHVS